MGSNYSTVLSLDIRNHKTFAVLRVFETRFGILDGGCTDELDCCGEPLNSRSARTSKMERKAADTRLRCKLKVGYWYCTCQVICEVFPKRSDEISDAHDAGQGEGMGYKLRITPLPL